jgi:type VI secretion system protein ImpL
MWQLDQIKYALGLGGMLGFTGALYIASMYIVPILTPKIGAAWAYSVVTIGIVLITLPFALVIGAVNWRRRKKAEKAELLEQEANAEVQQSATPAVNSDELSQSTEEATQYLKTSGLDVYSLPWYLIAGAPKAGKSSLVMSSGLNFQALPSQRQSEQNLIRATKTIDWRMTSDAVFIDTSGRYQTEGSDSAEWTGLLDTVKKYRDQRPIDGFLLVVNTERILNGDETAIEEMAKILRTRLDEVTAITKTRFPIYVVFTHADAIEGFRDSFSTSQKESENLVWGTTIPIEKSENAHTLFDSEFDILNKAVMKRRLVRLSAPFPPNRQLRIFNFPLHFGSSRKKIGHFVATLFRPNPFSESPFLRGFYFTSTPGDKTGFVGKSHFTKKFFRDVVLRDKDLVKNFLSQKQKPPIMGWLITALGTLLTLFFLLMSGISLFQNKQLVEEASTKAENVLTIYKADRDRDLFKKSTDETRAEITAIDDLRQTISSLDDYERNGAPWWMRFGMFSGNKIYKEKLLNIYFNAVEQRFKKPVIAKLESDLQKFASGTSQESEEVLDKNFDLLSSYLMLSGGETKKGDKYQKYAQDDFLAKNLTEFWKKEPKLPPGYEETAQRNLEFYMKQIDREEFPKIFLRPEIVTASRKKLQAFPAYLRYYKREVNKISKEVESTVGASTVASILTLAGGDSSFVEGSYQVPSAYTVEGYKKMKLSIRNTDQELSKDDWVMDEESKKEMAQTTDASKLEERYFKDYADHWKALVKGTTIKSYKKEDAARALQSFSAAGSPLDALLKEVYRQTRLSAKPKPRDWKETALDWVGMLPKLEIRENTKPESEFRPLFTFVGDDTKTEVPPLANYRKTIGQIYAKLNSRSQDEYITIAKDLAADKDTTLGLRNSETAISTLLNGFAETPAGQEIAELLKKPLGNLRLLLGADAQSQLGQSWTAEVFPKAKEAEKGFPFDDSGEADLVKLTAYLNPVNGTLSDFYTKRLEKYFEADGGGKLKVKTTSDVKFTDEFVNYLNNAFALRETLFGKNKDANFEYDFRLNPVKDLIIEVKIDGQAVTSEGTASSKLKFPAATNAETGVFINSTSTAEGSSTSGKTPMNSNANTTSNSNANSATPVSKFQSSPTETPAASNSKKRPGTWGLFLFFNDGSPKKNPSGGYDLSYKLGGKTITATIKPAGGDLFDRSLFKNVKVPENFLR